MGENKFSSDLGAKLSIGDNSFELPVVTGTEGEQAIDISKLRAASGLVTLDNGYVNTGSCKSSITFLDGDKGILHYRGYPIEDLAAKKSFLEVAFLLYNGELPSDDEKSHFEGSIDSWDSLPNEVTKILSFLPVSTHPMGALSVAFSTLTGCFPEFSNPDLSDDEKIQVTGQLMSYTKQIISNWYRVSMKKELIQSKGMSYCESFLYEMFGDKPRAEFAAALDVLLTLHADHEQNCSTSTVRIVGSSKANVYSSIVGGISALWGPLHGGANQAVVEMLELIQSNGGDHRKFLEKAKDKNDSTRLMGFGHRVYKNFDPRAKIIKSQCDSVLSALGKSDPLLDIAKSLEEEVLQDSYFIERKLYPNVDFYSGIIYRALGIPTEFFTALFALGRLPGWLAHWNEMRTAADFKIGRPRQIFTGSQKRTC